LIRKELRGLLDRDDSHFPQACGARTVVRPQYGADDGRGLNFFHFFAAAAMRVLLARAGFRTDLRDCDFATAGRVGTEGRSYPGWNHHAVLAAMTFLFLQQERRRRTNPLPTFPEVRNLFREVLAALSFIERPQWLKLAISFQRNPPLRI